MEIRVKGRSVWKTLEWIMFTGSNKPWLCLKYPEPVNYLMPDYSSCFLQPSSSICKAGPGHGMPSSEGGGLLHRLVLILIFLDSSTGETSQADHLVHLPQPPFTAGERWNPINDQVQVEWPLLRILTNCRLADVWPIQCCACFIFSIASRSFNQLWSLQFRSRETGVGSCTLRHQPGSTRLQKNFEQFSLGLVWRYEAVSMMTHQVIDSIVIIATTLGWADTMLSIQELIFRAPTAISVVPRTRFRSSWGGTCRWTCWHALIVHLAFRTLRICGEWIMHTMEFFYKEPGCALQQVTHNIGYTPST